MKKTTIYLFSFILGTLLVCSCVQPLEPGPRNSIGAHQLNLTVSCQSPITKAYENYPNGETALNENKVEHVDWFVFRDTAANATAAAKKPWTSGRVSYDNKADGTTEFQVTSLDMDSYLQQYADGKGFVYTIANYPGSFDEIEDCTYSELQMVKITTTLDNLENGKFKEQPNFVMTSELEPFTLQEDVPQTINAKLSRQAAKISLNIKVAPLIDELKATVSGIDTTGLDYVKTWYPDVENIQVYLSYANKHTKLSAVTTQTPIDSVEAYSDVNFFTYNRYGFQPSITWRNNNEKKDTAYVSGTPFYSYPMKWETSDPHAPFIKIILKWTGHKESFEKSSPQYDAQTGEWVSGGGRYINHSDDHEVIHGDTVRVTGHYGYSGAGESQEFYYKISLPTDTSYPNALRSNVWTKIDLDVAILGGIGDESSVEVAGRYYVVDWSDPSIKGGGELKAGLFLNVASESYNMYGDTLQIPVSASGPIVVSTYGYDYTTVPRDSVPTGTYPVITSTNPVRLTYKAMDGSYSESYWQGVNFMVDPADNAKYVTIRHKVEPFSTSFTQANNAKDIVKITYKFRVSLEGHESDFYKDITVTQYPAIYTERQQSRGRPFVNKTEGTANGVEVFNNQRSHTLGQVTNSLTGGVGTRSGFFTIVSVSTLSGLINTDAYKDWVIGDPRIKLSDAYNGTYQSVSSYHNDHANNSNASEWLRTDLGDSPDYFDNYLVGHKDASNVIAPKFMLASGYGYNGGATQNTSNWKSNSERCASYQEDGYPAGRWRVPTEAELLFCAVLASKGLIENPFVNNTNYWATSGRCLQYTSNSSTWNFNVLNSGTRSIRCIYDLWYWGDDPVATPGTYSVMLPE